MANLDSVLESRDVTADKGPSRQGCGPSPVVMYRRESWMIKKAEH